MMTEICGYLKNWFNRMVDGSDYPKFKGEITISDHHMNADIALLDGQYFRIVGSVLNDGVFKYSSEGISELKDETFTGEIWSMAVPTDVVALEQEIREWCDKYDKADAEAMSPFQSESFGGYSYSKGAGSNTGSNPSWISVFGSKLTRYKKL